MKCKNRSKSKIHNHSFHILEIMLIFVVNFKCLLTHSRDSFSRFTRIHYMKFIQITLIAMTLLLASVIPTSAQSNQRQQLDDINLQVKYINESIHGIMVANKLFELFNQDVNRYVDLESYKLQGFDNKDLPKNLFDETSQDYYEEKSPVAFYKAITSSKTISESNKIAAVQLYGIFSDIDKKRFDIERYLDLNDLSNRDNLSGIYALLENCVALYKNFYAQYREYSTLLNKQYDSIKNESFAGGSTYKTMREMHGHAVKAMHHIRTQKDAEVKSNLKNFALMYIRVKKDLQTHLGPFAGLKTNPNINPKIESTIGNIRDFTEGVPIQESYEQYGPHYHVHNKTAISKMNKYGNGWIQEINMEISSQNIPVMHLLQVPHYFKVIYPKKLEIVQQIASTQSFISTLPKNMGDRAIKEKSLVIKSPTKVFELELFDHMVQDGDLVSLNFNGDWILERYSLEKKSKRLRLELNPNGRNFLLLYAASVGQRPPNTMAVKYQNMQGEDVQIILKSDLKVSEILEIQYSPN